MTFYSRLICLHFLHTPETTTFPFDRPQWFRQQKHPSNCLSKTEQSKHGRVYCSYQYRNYHFFTDPVKPIFISATVLMTTLALKIVFFAAYQKKSFSGTVWTRPEGANLNHLLLILLLRSPFGRSLVAGVKVLIEKHF